MTMSATTPYKIVRRPDAAARRGGREWPVGESVAHLDEVQAAAIAADPGYRILAAPHSTGGRTRKGRGEA